MTPIGMDLDQYKTQAKDLLKLAKASGPQAFERFRASHPEHDALISSGCLTLSDAQLVIARENGQASWAKFKGYLIFRAAVQALDHGNVPALGTLLDEHPNLIKYGCRVGEWYESGYFSGAGLLQHIAGNPIRCPLPKNVVDITRLLLQHGADPNSQPSTTTLLLTSKQASEAQVAVTLIDILRDAGATDAVNLDDPLLLDDPIWNAGLETARELVRRGARMDLPQAAALGRIDVIRRILKEGEVSPGQLESALVFACVQNQEESVRYLLEQGAKGDVIPPTGRSGGGQGTALHNAAWRGFTGIVTLLLDSGATASVRDNEYNGTPADWAEHGGHTELAALLRQPRSSSSP